MSQPQLSQLLQETHGQKLDILNIYLKRMVMLQPLKKVMLLQRKKKNYHQPNTLLRMLLLETIPQMLSQVQQSKLVLKQLKLNQNTSQPQLSQLPKKIHGQKLDSLNIYLKKMVMLQPQPPQLQIKKKELPPA
jgi:hypothetical protein